MRGYAFASALGGLVAISLAAVVSACGPTTPSTDGGDVARAMWTCPDGWVAANTGGCGPAVLLCATNGNASGGAIAGACANVDITHGDAVTDDTGATIGRTLYRASDDVIRGAWHEDGDPTGPPPAGWTPDAGNGTSGDDWSPDAGIDSCPSGWMRLGDGTCDAVIRDNCANGAGALPGGGCTQTSDGDCPAGEYADPGAEAAGATILHVRVGADAALADGSVLHPYATVNDATSIAAAGTWILVAAGTYDERIEVTNDLHVLGVCAARVTLAGAGTTGIVHASTASARIDLRDVTLAGANEGARLEMGATGRFDRVVVTGTTRGVSVEDPGARLDATDVYVHDLVPLAGHGEAYGFVVDFGASVVMDRGAIVHARGAGMFVFSSNASVRLTDTLVDATIRGTNGAIESAVTAFNTASVTAERCVFRDSPNTGLAGTSDAHYTLTDCIVSHTHGIPSATAYGLDLLTTQLDATRLLVRETEGTGIRCVEGEARIHDSVIDASHAHESDTSGTGLGISVEDGKFLVERVRVSNSANFGIANPGDETSMLTITDSIVEGTRGFGSSPSAGIGIGSSGHAIVERTLVRDSIPAAIVASTAAVVTLRDSVLRDSHAMTNTGSTGLAVAGGASVTAERVRVTHTEGPTMVVQEPSSTLVISDSVLGPAESTIFSGEPFGGGIVVAEGARMTVSRVRVDHVPVFGFAVVQQNHTGTDAVIEDSVIADQLARQSGATGKLFGAGVAVSYGATATVRRTRFERNSPLAVFAYSGGSIATLRDCAIRDTQIGSEGTVSAALMAFSSGVIDGERIIIERSVDTGITSVTRGEIHLRDTLLLDVARDTFGFGTGVSASGDGIITLDRVGIVATNGAALMATPYHDPMTPRLTGASIVGNDVYVRSVGTSTIRVEYDEHDNPVVVGRGVAYGVHTGAMCSIDLTRAVLARAGFGFFASSGRVGLHHVVIADMLDSAGAQSGSMPVLDDVNFFGNASDAIVQSMDLPEGSMLQTPQAACATTDCR